MSSSKFLGLLTILTGIYGLMFYTGKIKSGRRLYQWLSRGKMSNLERAVLLMLCLYSFGLGVWFLIH